MLPFLKSKEGGAASAPAETITREPDEPIDMLDACAQDLMAAVKAGDVELLKGALQCLVEHIQDLDAQQDQGMSNV